MSLLKLLIPPLFLLSGNAFAETPTVKGDGYEANLIPSGSFMMGCPS